MEAGLSDIYWSLLCYACKRSNNKSFTLLTFKSKSVNGPVQ